MAEWHVYISEVSLARSPYLASSQTELNESSFTTFSAFNTLTLYINILITIALIKKLLTINLFIFTRYIRNCLNNL